MHRINAVLLRRPIQAVLFSLLLVLSACSLWDAISPGGNPMDTLSRPFSDEQIIQFVGAPLPANASSVSMQGEAALDTMVIVRFDLPAGEVAGFLQALGVTGDLRAGYTPFFSANPPYAGADWWQPPTPNASNADYRGLNEQVGAKFVNVVVVPAGENLETIYLQVFNT